MTADPDPERERKRADDALARRLLTRGVEPGGNEEIMARAALARRIRDLMTTGFIRELLALAIDPATPSYLGIEPTVIAEFKSPARGRPSTWARDLAIVDFVIKQRFRWTGSRYKQESAIKAAMEEFNLKRGTVIRALRSYEERQQKTAAWLRSVKN